MSAAAGAADSERWCIVLVVVERDGSLVLVVEPTRVAVPCPRCGELSRRQHSWYERHPLDLPWRGKVVRIRVHSRRWFCDAANCSRRIFAERFDGALARYARRTNDATELLTMFALQAGGEGGARLARKAGVPISPDTLLRILHSITGPDVRRGPRVLGVDDVALRSKQPRYGTLLIDLETHRPIDLLDGRTAEVFAGWLRQHPGVEIIVRDRAGANASAAMDEVLRSGRRHIEYVAITEPSADGDGPTPTAPEPPPSQSQQDLATRRSRRSARWDEVRARRGAGYSIQRIAREMGMHRRTVRRYLANPAPPRNRPSDRPKPGGLSSPTLQPYVPYLQGRWQAGCTNVAQLKRELEAQGYRGSYSLLMQALSPWRDPRPPPDPARRRRGRPRVKRINVRWLCLRPPDQLEPHEHDALAYVLDNNERLAAGYQLLQRFRRLVARRSVRDVVAWLADALESGLRPFASLARGIQADYTAVINGLKPPWSTGPIEGTVTRVKLLKRQGYGRASTQLLRRRVINAA